MDSWKQHLPDYQIIEWNESNFDINLNLFIKQAYAAKKYAFVSDFVRLHVLYEHGGIYMDTDVEVLRNIDIFLNASAFSGFENNEFVTTGIIGSTKGHPWIERLLTDYSNRAFIKNGTIDYTPNTETITEISKKEFGLHIGDYKQVLIDDVHIYPSEYFCPKDWMSGKIYITENTYTVHHFIGSWLPKSSLKIRFKEFIFKFINRFLKEQTIYKLRELLRK